jgi:uncharacterized protein
MNPENKALYAAIDEGKPDGVKAALKNGADVNCTEYIGEVTPLWRSVYKNNKTITKILLEHGADPNKTTNTKGGQEGTQDFLQFECMKDSPFLVSCWGSVEVVKLMLEYGADLEKTDDFGWSGVHFAVSSQRHAVLKLLLEKGANPEKKNKLKQSPLDIAVAEGNISATEILIKYIPLKNLAKLASKWGADHKEKPKIIIKRELAIRKTKEKMNGIEIEI